MKITGGGTVFNNLNNINQLKQTFNSYLMLAGSLLQCIHVLANSFKAFLCRLSLNSTPDCGTLLLMSKHKQIYGQSAHLQKQLGTNTPLLNFHRDARLKINPANIFQKLLPFKEPTET